MKLSRSVMLPLLFICLAGIGFYICISSSVNYHQLSKGCGVEIAKISFATNFPVSFGRPWQKILFNLFGTNLPSKLTGSYQIVQSKFGTGSVGVVFRVIGDEYANIDRHLGRFTLVETNGSEVEPPYRFMNFSTPHSQSKTIVTLFFELPPVPEKVIKLRYYPEASSTNCVEFLVPNPCR